MLSLFYVFDFLTGQKKKLKIGIRVKTAPNLGPDLLSRVAPVENHLFHTAGETADQTVDLFLSHRLVRAQDLLLQFVFFHRDLEVHPPLDHVPEGLDRRADARRRASTNCN